MLSQRERINELICTRLDQEAGKWGIKVANVEMRETGPSADIQQAMTQQMSAERVRRSSMVLELDGQREASITVVEGEKQAKSPSAPIFMFNVDIYLRRRCWCLIQFGAGANFSVKILLLELESMLSNRVKCRWR